MKDVIELAKQAGLYQSMQYNAPGASAWDGDDGLDSELERFAILLGNAKLEAAAVICDAEVKLRMDAARQHADESPSRDRCYAAARAAGACADAIRALKVAATEPAPITAEPAGDVIAAEHGRRCTYDNRVTMARECWEDGRLVFSVSSEMLWDVQNHNHPTVKRLHDFLPILQRGWRGGMIQGDSMAGPKP